MKQPLNKGLLPAILVLAMGISGCGNLLYSQSQAPIYSDTLSKRRGATAPSIINSTLTPVASTRRAPSRFTERPSNLKTQNSASPYGNSRTVKIIPVPSYNASTAQRAPATNNQPFVNQTINQSNYPANHGYNGANQAIETASSRIKTGSEALNQSMETAKNTAAANVARPSAIVNAAAENASNTAGAAQAAVEEAQAAAATSVEKAKTATGNTPSATMALLQEARTAIGSGNYDKAASALERAHRIEPGNAKILYDIAQIRYAQGKYTQAESFASKAATLSNSPGLSKKTWSLLSNSRKALGNTIGAETAAKKAASF